MATILRPAIPIAIGLGALALKAIVTRAGTTSDTMVDAASDALSDVDTMIHSSGGLIDTGAGHRMLKDTFRWPKH